MSQLAAELRTALNLASRDHDDTYEHSECDGIHDCIDWIVVTALRETGNLEADDDTIMSCIHWVMDEVLESLILKGYAEVSGVNENGELTFSSTAKAEQLFREIHG